MSTLRKSVGANLRRSPLIGLSIAVLVATSAMAQPVNATRMPDSALSVVPDATRVRMGEELRGMLLDMAASGAFADVAPQDLRFQIDEPAQKVDNLGLLVDSSTNDSDGLHVIATTPGGAADRMGIRAGDRLVAVSGQSLLTAGASAASARRSAELLRQHIAGLDESVPVNFSLRRDGTTLALSGPVTRTWLPALHLRVGDGVAVASAAAVGTAMAQTSAVSAAASTAAASTAEGCGRISIFDVAPRNQQLHAATLIAIDGVTPGPTGSPSYQVSAGPHKLTVGERIESRYLSINDAERNAPINRYKTLNITVKPDTTYYLASHFNQDKALEFANNGYWDPVIWRETPEQCGAYH